MSRDDKVYRRGDCLYFHSRELQEAANEAVTALSHSIPHFAESYTKPRIQRDGDLFHVTLVAKSEIPQLCHHFQEQDRVAVMKLAEESAEREILKKTSTEKQDCARSAMVQLGIGIARSKESQCYYGVICWPDAAVWRHRHGLPPAEFHMTLGFQPYDVHGVRKDHTTLLPSLGSSYSASSLEAVAQSIFKHLQSRENNMALETVVEILEAAVRYTDDNQQECVFSVLRAKCKLLSNHRRFDQVLVYADECLSFRFPPNCAYYEMRKPVRAMRAMALFHLGRPHQALRALEWAVSHMTDLKSPKRIELLQVATTCRVCIGDQEMFVKFPRTAHIFDAGGKAVTRDDLLVKDIDFFLGKLIYGEEKVDGSNMGFSVSASGKLLCQNRSHFVTASSQSQYQKLPLWLDQFGSALREFLEPGRHVLFGEWIAMVHSLCYTRLPGYFIAFDFYDKYTETFATREELHARLRPTGIPVVPVICKRTFAFREEFLPLLDTQSRFRDGPLEGVYLRFEDADGSHRRCKLVRPNFVSGIELHRALQIQKKNIVCQDMALEYDGYTEASVIENERRIFDPRSRVTVNLKDGRSVRMIRNVSFLIPDQLVVASTPKHKAHIDALRHLGFTLVIALTEEEPLDASWFGDGIENLFVPVPNNNPPTVGQVDMIVERVLKSIAEGGIVLEHCGGGKGRAGSLETVQQEKFVHQYAQHVWKELADADRSEQRSHQQKSNLKESLVASGDTGQQKPKASTRKEAQAAKKLAKQKNNLIKRAPHVVMLVGIPGSGNSTFAASLETVSEGWKKISQDELGRKKCEELAGTWSKTDRVVLDRCNVESSDRKHWLDLMHNPKRCAAVFFDISVGECVERVRARENHPTIRGCTPGSGKIIQGFHERLRVPTKEEGFECVYFVRSLEDSRQILRSWSVNE